MNDGPSLSPVLGPFSSAAPEHYSMIRKSGYRFSEKIMLKQ
jgi:hypothetical protein